MASEVSTESFLKTNWKFILAAVIATGVTAGVIYSFQSSAPPRKKSKKKKRSSKTSDDSKNDTTTLEEPADAIELQKDVVYEPVVDKNELALEQKTVGNKLYAEKKYEEAIEKYTNAIDILPTAVYYCNRAACYSNLGKHQLTIDDCTKAIELDPKYIKAFHRRGLAHEQLGNKRAALNEYTAVCALENFQNQTSMAAPDRILKVIASERASELFSVKKDTMPSETFITAYLDSFRSTPNDSTIINELGPSESDESLKLLKEVFEFVAKHEWQQSLELVSKAIELDTFAETSVKAKALNYRGTMYFLMGKVAEAVADLELSLEFDPENINTIIKRATLYMEGGDVEKTIEQFKKAELLAPKHPDLFYHRGQVRFLTGDFNGACEDYERSIEFEKPEESTVYVHIQLGVAKYKLGDMIGAEKKFKEAKKKFPNSAEVWNYHGEILLDKQDYREAEISFDKAIEMEPTSPLPYINKAILYVQWKQDAATAETLCRKAIDVDPLCDIAYTQLAQLLCLSNKLDEAVSVYDKAIQIARTEVELINVLSCQEAALAQKYVVSIFPEAMNNSG